jgi:inositol-phosphate phosphatase / L-galactose 1-phosphate phosphatase / histidinol-phosphatase
MSACHPPKVTQPENADSMGLSGHSQGASALPAALHADWLPFAHGLADVAHGMLAKAAADPPPAALKADKSFVTAMDAQIEAALRERIVGRYPRHGIIGEEGETVQGDAEVAWIIDPIDGTAPFLAGVPVFGTLIALAVDGVPVLGIMDLPVTRERYVGIAGAPSTCNGRTLRTRSCAGLGQAVMSASNPDFFKGDDARALAALRDQTAWRIYGGCCMAYGLLSAGRTDIALDANFKIYDYAPFKPLVEGAGGVITDWEGQPVTLASGSRVLAAGDALAHAQARDVLERALA